ncbi:MAG: PAS domain S-box protein [Thermoplasmata archaeon]
MEDRARRERDADYASALTGILDASTEYSIVATELDGTFILWNEGARRIYGYESPEVLGRNIRILHRPEDVSSGKVDEMFNGALAQGGWEGVCLRVRKGGPAFETRITLTVRRDPQGRPIGFLSVSKDISEELRRDRRLQESESYNRVLIESASDGILTTDLEGRIADVNKEMVTLSGISREDLVGRRLREVMVPETAADAAILQVLAEGRVTDIELKLRRPNGELADVSCSATVLRHGSDPSTGLIATIRDVTEAKRLREQLEVRNRELEVQNERVLEANRMKSEFLASMSHELRTPLNSIIGFSDFLLTADGDRLAADQREYLTDILNSGNHLLSLINDILDLAKVESGKLDLSPVPFTLSHAIEEVCSSLRPQLQQLELALNTDVTPAINRVVLDRRRFKQILYNLLSNAVKFTPKGGRIDVTVGSNGPSQFVLGVRDTGIGIPANEIPRVFREFEQLDSGTARKYSGSGLGLPLTQKLVDLMGGTIAVESEVGRGSTFTVHLPLVLAGGPSPGAPNEGVRV